MDARRAELPSDIDPSTPNIARMYDYALGGKDNFAADREVAEQVWRLHAAGPRPALENRGFLRRAVRFLTTAGIRQFLDLGSGLPTQGNVHEVAQSIAPDARAVYVDYDPVAVAHGRALLSGSGATAVIHQDIREPEAILEHPDVTRLLDFSEPVAILMLAVLHVVTDDDDPVGLVGRYRSALVPGSFLAISHLTCTGQPAESLGGVREVFREEKVREPIAYRSRAEISRFFEGVDLVEPGLVTAPDWRPDDTDAGIGSDSGTVLVGVGRLPDTGPR